MYLIAIGIFELGSLLCGVAPNSTALIVGRAVAGVGSAGIFSGVSHLLGAKSPSGGGTFSSQNILRLHSRSFLKEAQLTPRS